MREGRVRGGVVVAKDRKVRHHRFDATLRQILQRRLQLFRPTFEIFTQPDTRSRAPVLAVLRGEHGVHVHLRPQRGTRVLRVHVAGYVLASHRLELGVERHLVAGDGAEERLQYLNVETAEPQIDVGQIPHVP